jgi:hypothetical protein
MQVRVGQAKQGGRERRTGGRAGGRSTGGSTGGMEYTRDGMGFNGRCWDGWSEYGKERGSRRAMERARKARGRGRKREGGTNGSRTYGCVCVHKTHTRSHARMHARMRAQHARPTDLLRPRAQLCQRTLVGANGLEAVELRSEREVRDELREGVPECNVPHAEAARHLVDSQRPIRYPSARIQAHTCNPNFTSHARGCARARGSALMCGGRAHALVAVCMVNSLRNRRSASGMEQGADSPVHQQ